jgi:nucleotidyltransferase/DNA polymerase involved in DNA repair
MAGGELQRRRRAFHSRLQPGNIYGPQPVGLDIEVRPAVRRRATFDQAASLEVKFADFELISRSRTLAGAVSSHDELENVSAELLKAIFPTEKAVRLLGVSISSFAPTQMDTPSQIALL